MRRTRLLLAAAVVLVGLGVFVVRGAGRFLVVADPLPAHADVIVMLAGSLSDRVLETARLYHAGVAPLVVLTRVRLRRGAPALRAHGVFLPEEHELASRALGELGVPASAIRVVSRRAASTTTEARAHRALGVPSRVPSRRRRDVADAHAACADDPPAGVRSPASS